MFSAASLPATMLGLRAIGHQLPATADQDLPHAGIPNIRLLVVKKKAIDYPLNDVDTEGWAASTPDTAKVFSAVAWYFAREIEQREHVPVGVVDSAWGGTPVEAWTRLAALGADAAVPGLNRNLAWLAARPDRSAPGRERPLLRRQSVLRQLSFVGAH